MASISKQKGAWRVIFTLDDRRRIIHLGKESKKTAETWRDQAAEAVSAKLKQCAPNLETSRWIGSLDPAMHRKLHGRKRKDGNYPVGLVEPRQAAEKSDPTLLGDFLDDYVKRRSDDRRSKSTVFGHTRRCLIEYFETCKPLDSITPGNADDFARWLRQPKPKAQGLAENTARRRCGIAKQFFRAAVRHKIICENPFADMRGISVLANRDRYYYVTDEEAQKVLDACPDAQWRLLFVLLKTAR